MNPRRKQRMTRSQTRRNQSRDKITLNMVKKLNKRPTMRMTTNKRTRFKKIATQLLSKRQKLNLKNKKEKVTHLIKIKKERIIKPKGDGEAEEIERDLVAESGETEVIEVTEEEREAIDLTLPREMKILKALSLFKIRTERIEVEEAEAEEAEEDITTIIEVEEEAEETEVAEAVPTRRMAASREEVDQSREGEDLPAAKQVMKETNNKHLLNRLLKSENRRMTPQRIMNEDGHCWGNTG